VSQPVPRVKMSQEHPIPYESMIRRELHIPPLFHYSPGVSEAWKVKTVMSERSPGVGG
jgi:hypothetical protein